jgi:hypothetical protein
MKPFLTFFVSALVVRTPLALADATGVIQSAKVNLQVCDIFDDIWLGLFNKV